MCWAVQVKRAIVSSIRSIIRVQRALDLAFVDRIGVKLVYVYDVLDEDEGIRPGEGSMF